MKKKLLTLLVILTLALSLAVPAMAAAGSATINDNDGNNGTANPSTGVVTGVTGTNVNTKTTDPGFTGDNKLSNSSGDDSQDIDVYARIYDAASDIRYTIDIAWGNMRFVYSRGARTWNPSTHKYESTSTGGSWVTDNTNVKINTTDAAETYLMDDATPSKTLTANDNNKIVVINHSNAAVEATFVYALDGTVALGGDTDGGFYATAAGAKTGAAITANPANGNGSFSTLNGYGAPNKIVLYSGVGRNPASNNDIWKPVYFAFSGKPDTTVDISAFNKVGKITVTIAPYTAADAGTYNAKGNDAAW